MAVFLYAFREREELMDVLRGGVGARMHATYYRPGGVYRDLPEPMPQYRESPWRKGEEAQALQRVARRLDAGLPATRSRDDFPKRVDEYETLLTDNRIWKQRTVGIGVDHAGTGAGLGHDRARCCAVRASNGTCARSSRTRSTPKSISTSRSACNGDCYDRYLVRVAEMRQSTRIIQQCVDVAEGQPGPGDAGQLQGRARRAARR